MRQRRRKGEFRLDLRVPPKTTPPRLLRSHPFEMWGKGRQVHFQCDKPDESMVGTGQIRAPHNDPDTPRLASS